MLAFTDDAALARLIAATAIPGRAHLPRWRARAALNVSGRLISFRAPTQATAAAAPCPHFATVAIAHRDGCTEAILLAHSFAIA